VLALVVLAIHAVTTAPPEPSEPSRPMTRETHGPLADAPGPEEPAASNPARTSAPAGAREEAPVRVPSEAVAFVVGRLVDAEGRPVSGGSVRLEFPHTGDRPVAGEADDRGAFEVRLSLSGDHGTADLVATGPTHVPVRVTIAVRPGETSHVGDLVLAAGGAAHGRVVDEDGRPIAGAWVTEGWPRVPPESQRRRVGPRTFSDAGEIARTDADGRFRLAGIRPGPRRLYAGTDGHLAGASSLVAVRAGETTEVPAIALRAYRPEEILVVRVLAPDGSPVPRADLRYRYRSLAGSGGGSRVADENGRVRFIVDPGDVYEITALDPRERWARSASRDHRGGDEVELRLGSFRDVEIVVRDGEGRPVERFEAALLDADGGHLRHWPDDAPRAEGRLTLRVPDMPFRVRVAAPGHAETETEVLGPGGIAVPIAITLRALPGIRGFVTRGGRPVAGARVVLYAMAPRGQRIEHDGFVVRVDPHPRAETASDGEGRFALTLREAGRYVVRAESDGAAPTELGPMTLDPASGRDDLEIALSSGGTLAGTVLVDPERSPAGTIVAVSRGDGHARTRRVGPDGRYRFERLTPGPWLVRLAEEEILPDRSGTTWTQGTSEPESNCEVREGEVTEHDLDARTAAAPRLTGRLAVDGASLETWTATIGPRKPILTDAEVRRANLAVDGTFELVAQDAGPSRLFLAEARTGLRVIAELDLRGGDNRFTLELETAPLSGRLRPGTTLFYLREESETVLVLLPLRSEEDGRLAPVRVPIGAARLVARSPAGEPDPRRWPVIRAIEVKRETGATLDE
jgi:hypothetical protein